MESDRDLNHVFNLLDKMKQNEIIIISDYSNGRDEVFISCCKQYIDCYNAGEFNDNYTKFKKIEKCEY